MKSSSHPIIRFLFLVAVGALVLRLLPLIARVAQGAVVGLRGYGWILLLSVVSFWAIRKIRRRRQIIPPESPLGKRRGLHVVDVVAEMEPPRT